MVSLLMLGMLATACGGDDPTPAAPSVTAQDIQDAVDRAIAGAAAGDTSPEEIQSMIEAAVSAAAAGSPEGLTASQVEAIVAAAASPEGLSASEVEGIVTAALAAQAAKETAPTGPFVIGVMESLTGPGETYGNVAVQAKLLAVSEINAAGGIDGRQLKLIIEDSKCNARDSITAYTKLTSVDGVKIILGTSCSGAMLGAAPLAEKDGVIMFSGLATNPLVADAGDFIFRTAINDKLVGVDTGNTLWSDGIRKLATITEATDYAEGVRRETATRFEQLGGEIVAAEGYASEETDYRAAITRIIGKNPDAIHIAAQAEFAGGTIMKQLRELGWDGPIYGEIVVIGSTALDVAGDAATGVKGIVPALDPSNTKAIDFLKRFRDRYDYTTLEWFMGSAYDDVYITAACLSQTGDDQDAEGFRDCLYAMEPFEGTIGTYTFDSDGEVVGLSNAVAEVLPVAERTAENSGWKILGAAPILP
ncbi:MAG: ABC transporter substrate-binding protein [Chloroflexi bacterium]|nr:ABC transporter substrate-binding protein [Chloroflexota bacterium]